jgi:hypothetical protein
MFAEVAAVIAVELENAAMFGLTGEPLVVTVPPPHELGWAAYADPLQR